MTISPDDVRQKRFRIALRGYVVEEVDAFMDEVEHALTNPGETTDNASQAVHTLRLAEQLADQLVADARAEAAAMLGEAEAAARTQTTALLNQAHADARDLLANAQDQALQRKAELQAAIAKLQAMEHAQREQLQLLLQEQLRVLSEPGRPANSVHRTWSTWTPDRRVIMTTASDERARRPDERVRCPVGEQEAGRGAASAAGERGLTSSPGS